jgi:hypothetical protein
LCMHVHVALVRVQSVIVVSDADGMWNTCSNSINVAEALLAHLWQQAGPVRMHTVALQHGDHAA